MHLFNPLGVQEHKFAPMFDVCCLTARVVQRYQVAVNLSESHIMVYMVLHRSAKLSGKQIAQLPGRRQ